MSGTLALFSLSQHVKNMLLTKTFFYAMPLVNCSSSELLVEGHFSPFSFHGVVVSSTLGQDAGHAKLCCASMQLLLTKVSSIHPSLNLCTIAQQRRQLGNINIAVVRDPSKAELNSPCQTITPTFPPPSYTIHTSSHCSHPSCTPLGCLVGQNPAAPTAIRKCPGPSRS